MAENLFNSTTDPVPPLRYEIELIPVKVEGRDYIYLHDSMGYASPDIVLQRDFIDVLRLFDGRQNIGQIIAVLSGNSNKGRDSGNDVGNESGIDTGHKAGDNTDDTDVADVADVGNDAGHKSGHKSGENVENDVASDENDASMFANLLNVVRFLDENRLLQSAFFREKKQEIEREFEKGMLRPAVCAGTSYPNSPELIRMKFDEAFEKAADTAAQNSFGQTGKIRALYAPHIDIRVGLHVYARAFAPLKNLRPKRVVILATSHYSGMYFPYYEGHPYMVSRKDFETPFGSMSCDRQFCEQLAKDGDEAGVTLRDRSHRLEHSIELHLIFLKYLWDHDFSIVPVLVGPLEELLLMENGHQADQVAKFTSRLNSMLDDDTLVLISGDQAHFGKKFGDRIPAADRFDDIREFDRQFLADAARGSADGIMECIRAVSDEFRICGFPPLYTWLKTDANARGSVTAYDLWDERDQESAVSFGSVLYTDQ